MYLVYSRNFWLSNNVDDCKKVIPEMICSEYDRIPLWSFTRVHRKKNDFDTMQLFWNVRAQLWQTYRTLHHVFSQKCDVFKTKYISSLASLTFLKKNTAISIYVVGSKLQACATSTKQLQPHPLETPIFLSSKWLAIGDPLCMDEAS